MLSLLSRRHRNFGRVAAGSTGFSGPSGSPGLPITMTGVLVGGAGVLFRSPCLLDPLVSPILVSISQEPFQKSLRLISGSQCSLVKLLGTVEVNKTLPGNFPSVSVLGLGFPVHRNTSTQKIFPPTDIAFPVSVFHAVVRIVFSGPETKLGHANAEQSPKDDPLVVLRHVPPIAHTSRLVEHLAWVI